MRSGISSPRWTQHQFEIPGPVRRRYRRSCRRRRPAEDARARYSVIFSMLAWVNESEAETGMVFARGNGESILSVRYQLQFEMTEQVTGNPARGHFFGVEAATLEFDREIRNRSAERIVNLAADRGRPVSLAMPGSSTATSAAVMVSLPVAPSVCVATGSIANCGDCCRVALRQPIEPGHRQQCEQRDAGDGDG